ncbi:MAG: IS630 family transposase, partial [Planctomycetota bacterium]
DYHPTPAVRRRANALLLSEAQMCLKQIANLYQIDPDSVSEWIDRWENHGLAGLYDAPRSGRPPTFNVQEKEQIQQEIQKTPRELKRVVNQLNTQSGKNTCLRTVQRVLETFHYTWKRIRLTTTKKPDPQIYKQKQQLIHSLQQQETQGTIDLRYFDVSGFSLQSSVPYAWQPRGTWLEVPAQHSPRLQVVGFMNRANQLTAFTFEGTLDATCLIACFDAFAKQISKKTVVLLDNSPLHKSHAFIARIAIWAKQKLILKFLPTYSPQLNLIEILWRFIKYRWLSFEAYHSFENLTQAVEQILNQVGAQYKINFNPT